MSEDRRYEYKIVPLDRKTARPIALGAQVVEIKPCIVAGINALYEVMDKVSPRRGLQNIVPVEQDRDLLIKSFARIASEMFGADIYYRREGDTGAWQQQKGALPSGRRVE